MSSQPLLVYNRIDRNNRLTRVMLLAFAVAMLPSVTAASVFAVPFVTFVGGAIAYAVYGPTLKARIQTLEPGDRSADAALLTRDPAGLAAALIKIGKFRGERLSVGEGSVHLYFVDPEREDSLLHRLFPSHPPLEQRIQLLARMAQGIARST